MVDALSRTPTCDSLQTEVDDLKRKMDALLKMSLEQMMAIAALTAALEEVVCADIAVSGSSPAVSSVSLS